MIPGKIFSLPPRKNRQLCKFTSWKNVTLDRNPWKKWKSGDHLGIVIHTLVQIKNEIAQCSRCQITTQPHWWVSEIMSAAFEILLNLLDVMYEVFSVVQKAFLFLVLKSRILRLVNWNILETVNAFKREATFTDLLEKTVFKRDNILNEWVAMLKYIHAASYW